MFKFDLKHGNYHLNKLVPRISVENWKSWILWSCSFCQSDLTKPVSVWKDYSSFSKLLVQKTVKDNMFVG